MAKKVPQGELVDMAGEVAGSVWALASHVVGAIIVIWFAYHVFRNRNVILEKVKENIFTLHGVIVAGIWALLSVGVLNSLSFFFRPTEF